MTPHDEWDYDGVNENILFDFKDGQKLLQHFDRNGFAYTIDRTNGKLTKAEPYGPVNWATKVDRRLASREDPRYDHREEEHRGHLPGRDRLQGPAARWYSPVTGLFYVPTNHICMDYEGVEVKYTAGQPYVGAIVRMFPGPGGTVAASSPGIRRLGRT